MTSSVPFGVAAKDPFDPTTCPRCGAAVGVGVTWCRACHACHDLAAARRSVLELSDFKLLRASYAALIALGSAAAVLGWVLRNWAFELGLAMMLLGALSIGWARRIPRLATILGMLGWGVLVALGAIALLYVPGRGSIATFAGALGSAGYFAALSLRVLGRRSLLLERVVALGREGADDRGVRRALGGGSPSLEAASGVTVSDYERLEVVARPVESPPSYRT